MMDEARRPITGQTETWLSADSAKRVHAGEPHPGGKISIEFKSTLIMSDESKVVITGLISGTVIYANHVAFALHNTFAQGNLGLAVAQQLHETEAGELRQQIKALQAEIKGLQEELDDVAENY